MKLTDLSRPSFAIKWLTADASTYEAILTALTKQHKNETIMNVWINTHEKVARQEYYRKRMLNFHPACFTYTEVRYFGIQVCLFSKSRRWSSATGNTLRADRSTDPTVNLHYQNCSTALFYMMTNVKAGGITTLSHMYSQRWNHQHASVLIPH